jgi:hypothetical protein
MALGVRTGVKAALNLLAFRLALIIIGTLFGLIGALFLLASVFLRLTEIWGLPVAAFLTGVMALVGSAIVILILWVQGRSDIKGDSRSNAGGSEANAAETLTMAGTLGAELGSWVKANSRTAVVCALLTGVLFGASPRARAALHSFIKSAGANREPRD